MPDLDSVLFFTVFLLPFVAFDTYAFYALYSVLRGDY